MSKPAYSFKDGRWQVADSVPGGFASFLAFPQGSPPWATPLDGEIGYVSGDAQLDRASALSLQSARAVCAYSGGNLYLGGVVPVLFEAGLDTNLAPAYGQAAFVSATTPGRATNYNSFAAGQVNSEVGIIWDATGYNNATGSVLLVVWQPKAPILI